MLAMQKWAAFNEPQLSKKTVWIN